MAKISSYISDTSLTTGDKVLGTDTSGVTRNYTLGQLGTFIQGTYTLDLSNGVDNRLITSTDADSLSGEANLTFDGSTLAVTGATTVSGDTDITGSALVTQNLRRTVSVAAEAPSNTFTCDLSLNDNFKFTVNNAANQTIALTVATENIGQSGNIIITNCSTVNLLTFAALPAYMKTPSGATVNFDTTADKIAVISYIVLATDSVLVNYIGDFS